MCIRDRFGAARDQLVGQSFQVLYPSALEFERTGQRIAPLLNRNGTYSDDRIMKRVDGRFKGETFWCHVTGRALNQTAPHEAGIWTFEDLSSSRPVKAELTAREREVAAHLMDGLTSKAVSYTHLDVYKRQLTHNARAQTTGLQPALQSGGNGGIFSWHQKRRTVKRRRKLAGQRAHQCGRTKDHQPTFTQKVAEAANIQIGGHRAVSDHHVPVSYTHLDVYKRQHLNGCPGHRHTPWARGVSGLR